MYFNYTSIKLEKMNQKEKIKEQQQQKRHMFGRIHTKLLTGSGKQGRNYLSPVTLHAASYFKLFTSIYYFLV